MPIELIVVGEDQTDRQWLLVQGSDGRCYKYHPRRGRLVPVGTGDRHHFTRVVFVERVSRAISSSLSRCSFSVRSVW